MKDENVPAPTVATDNSVTLEESYNKWAPTASPVEEEQHCDKAYICIHAHPDFCQCILWNKLFDGFMDKELSNDTFIGQTIRKRMKDFIITRKS